MNPVSFSPSQKMNISDLAKKLGVTQKAIRETAADLKLAVKATAKTVSTEEGKKIEQALMKKEPGTKKSVAKKEPAEKAPKTAVKEKQSPQPEAPKEKTAPAPVIKEKTAVDEEIEALLAEEAAEPLDSTDAAIQEVEEDLEREILRGQKKQRLTSGKAGKEEKGKAAVLTDAVPGKKEGVVSLPAVISVKEFAEKLSIPANQIVAELMKNGLIVTINHKIDFDTAAIVASSFNVELQKEREDFSSAALMEGNIEQLLKNEDPSQLQKRPPIISIMGHVDHGKTKLLDYIRQSNVIATEAGGITQKIGAYQVKYKEKEITFLDTPGHEAFTAMRARGAKATDIAILVIAADEGVKQQTKEAYDHIKEAGIPVIVALNKIDKPGVNLEQVRGQLSEMGLVPEAWGGNTIVVPLSALTGQGVDELLDMILLVADLHPLQANPHRAAIGTVIESNLDPNLGPIATVLINTGTLRVMDYVVIGEAYGRIKVMMDHTFAKISEAGPSAPVQIVGLSEVPAVGDILQAEQTLEQAKKRALEIKTLRQSGKLSATMGSGMSDIIAKIHAGQLKTLKIVLKADTKGSLEAIRAAIDAIHSEEVEAKVIHSNVGNITETDVLMAAASGGIVMGFAVNVPPQVEKAMQRSHVEVRNYKVIYQLLEDVKKILLGLLDPELREVVVGEASVLAIFLKDRKGIILGARITKGKAENNLKVRIIRDQKLVGEGTIASLQREKERAAQVQEGYECGIRYEGSGEVEVGDLLEMYKIEKIKKESL